VTVLRKLWTAWEFARAYARGWRTRRSRRETPIPLVPRVLGRLKRDLCAAQACLRGWRTRHRIVVIESDDWGSIRVSSREAAARLAAEGYDLRRSPWGVDALETEEDLDRLFEVLQRFRDARGRPACLTANVVMANPDFARIREARFQEYQYEPVAATLARLPGRKGVPARWADGAARGIFVPQFHAREHVRWWEWLEAFRAGSREARLTFDLEMCGVPQAASREGRSFYVPLYLDDGELQAHGVDLDRMITEGMDLFERQFGRRSLSTVAPNCCWTDRAEQVWSRCGVRYIQGMAFQYVGGLGGRLRPHFVGQRTRQGGWYLVRNGVFEPAAEGPAAVGRCLREVARAFRFGKPAIISSHRVNYIGSIEPRNCTEGLRQLKTLLEAICRRWPNVWFLSSPELGRMIEGGMEADEGFDP